MKIRSVRIGALDAVTVARSGDLLAGAGTRDYVWVYTIPDLREVAKLSAQEGRVFQASFLPQKHLVATAEWAGGVGLWDIRHQRLVGRVKAPGRTNAVTFSPDGTWLAGSIGAGGWCVIVWETSGYREAYRFKAQGTSMFGPGFACVTFIDNQKLAAGGLDGCVYVWDLRAGKLVQRLCGHTQPIWRVAALPAEGLLASSSMDNTVVIWDWQRGKQVAVLPGTVVASCPSKGLLAISSGTKPVVLQLWEARSFRIVASQKVDVQNTMDMAFSADGKYLVTVGNGESVIVWRVEQ
jgi:WD40 repeat protein